MKLYLFIFILFIFSTFNFYSFNVLEGTNGKLLGYILFALFTFVNIPFLIKRRSVNKYSYPLVVLILSLLVSFVPAFFVHNQSFGDSFISSLPILSVLMSVYYLYLSEIDPDIVEKLILKAGWIFLALFFIKRIMPGIPFGEIQDFLGKGDGGITAVLIRGSVFCIPCVYYFVHKYKDEKHISNLVKALLFASPFILSYNRQHTVCIIFISILIISSFQSKVRTVISILAIVGILLTILPQIPYVQIQMRNTVKEYNKYGAENVRLLAIKGFIDEFQVDPLSRAFGNGVPAVTRSDYGNKMEKIFVKKGTYFADVGIAGVYYLFGIFYVLGLFMMIYVSLKCKNNSTKYLNNFLIHVVFSCLSCGILIYNFEFLVVLLSSYVITRKEALQCAN